MIDWIDFLKLLDSLIDFDCFFPISSLKNMYMLEVVLNKSTERKYMKHRPNQKHDAQLLGCLLVKPGSNNRLKKKTRY